MGRKRSAARRQLLERHKVYNSWALVSEELGGINRGMLCAVGRGTKTASRPLIDRMNKVYHLHLPYETKIEVLPLSCGHAPLRDRCPICKPPTKYAAHPVMRLAKLKKLIESKYNQS